MSLFLFPPLSALKFKFCHIYDGFLPPIRFSFNNPLPSSVMYKDALFISQWGQSNSPWMEKRITHKEGWSMVLMANTYYNFTFENAEHMTNISFDSVFYRFDVSGVSFIDADMNILNSSCKFRLLKEIFAIYIMLYIFVFCMCHSH